MTSPPFHSLYRETADLNLSGTITPEQLPYTKEGLDRVVAILWQDEQTRNARLIINVIAQIASSAYQQAKLSGSFVSVDRPFVDTQASSI